MITTRTNGARRLLALAALLTACVAGAPADEPRPGVLPPARDALAPAPFDLAAVVQRVHFAWRPADGGWAGGHVTYAARADAWGVTFTSYRDGHEGAPVTLGAATFARGGVALPSGDGAGRVAEAGPLVLARGAAEETLRNTEAGVEQSWAFAARPAGSGDLTVRFRVAGARYVGETAGGLHFAGGDGGPGVRYGHGTWVDASGARTVVPARYAGGAIELAVPAPVVDAAEYPAVLDPMISPEWGIDRPVFAPAPVGSAALASNGRNYLVAWSGHGGIVGARVAPDGTVLDPGGFGITTTSGGYTQSFGSPVVGSDGDGYLVLWSYSYYGSTNPISGVQVTRVSADGDVAAPSIRVGVPGTLTSSGAHYPLTARIVSNGRGFLVAWGSHNEDHSTGRVGAVLVSPEGTTVDVPLAEGVPAEAVAAASDGDGYLVAWWGGGARVRADGTVAPLPAVPWAAGALTAWSGQIGGMAMAFDGRDYLVVWPRPAVDGTTDLVGARVSPEGAVRDPAGFAVSTAPGMQFGPAAAFNGADVLVAWEDSRAGAPCPPCAPGEECSPCRCNALCLESMTTTAIYGTRVSPGARVRDAAGFRLSEDAAGASLLDLASNGRNALLLRSTSAGFRGARVDRAGAVLDPEGLVIALDANTQARPAVASDGRGYLVVWEDRRAGTDWDIYGARVDRAGRVLDPAGIAVSTARGDQTAPSVGFDAGRYLVAWQDRRGGGTWDVFAARVDREGAVLDPRSVAVSRAPREQGAVAVAGSLVVWSDSRGAAACRRCRACDPCACDPTCGPGFDRAVFAARVGADGAVLDPDGIAVSPPGDAVGPPGVAFDGARYLVAWASSLTGVTVARVGAGGAVLDAAGVPLGGFASGLNPPAVAAGGGRFLVVWETTDPVPPRRDGRSNPAFNAYAASVSPHGGVLNPGGTLITPVQDDPQWNRRSFERPTAAFDGRRYLVAWQVRTSSSLFGGTTTYDVAGTWLGADGATVESGPFFLAVDPMAERAPSVASDGRGGTLVAWQGSRFAASDSDRVRARVLSSGAAP